MKILTYFRKKRSIKYVKELLEWRIKDIKNEEELKKVIHDELGNVRISVLEDITDKPIICNHKLGDVIVNAKLITHYY